MLEGLKNRIRSYNPKITDEELDAAAGYYKEKHYKKGDFIIQPGQYVMHWNYILSGCVCYYQIKDGQEKVLEFFEEDDFFTDLYAYLKEQPSNCFLKVMEDTHLLSISKEDAQKTFDSSHAIERFSRLSIQDSFIKAFRRISHLNTLSNEERYLRLLKKRPKLFQRVPQYLIASYLGVTPVGLSKIRKRLSKS